MFELCSLFIQRFQVDIRYLKYDIAVWLVDFLCCPFADVTNAARRTLTDLSAQFGSFAQQLENFRELQLYFKQAALERIIRDETEILFNEIEMRLRYADMESLDLVLSAPRLLSACLQVQG